MEIQRKRIKQTEVRDCDCTRLFIRNSGEGNSTLTFIWIGNPDSEETPSFVLEDEEDLKKLTEEIRRVMLKRA